MKGQEDGGKELEISLDHSFKNENEKKSLTKIVPCIVQKFRVKNGNLAEKYGSESSVNKS